MEFTICKRKKGVLWKQCAPQILPTISWENLKKYIYPYTHSFVNSYSRFVDYIFFLSNGPVVQLQGFIKKLNNLTIEFDCKYSKISIEVLDRAVHKNKEQNKLLTTVYCKPIDQRSFLHHTSAQRRSLVKKYTI